MRRKTQGMGWAALVVAISLGAVGGHGNVTEVFANNAVGEKKAEAASHANHSVFVTPVGFLLDLGSWQPLKRARQGLGLLW